jgi:hypothetical protein
MHALEMGFLLDRRWHWMRGEEDRSKERSLRELAHVLAEASVPYALIGGVALQLRQEEPRTTLDIDVAVTDLDLLPRAALEKSGFRETGRHAHSENWNGPDGTPVQFTDDKAFGRAIDEAEVIQVQEVFLRVLRAQDLLLAKVRAATDPARRRSKRLQDLADAQSLLERDPSLRDALDDEAKALLDRALR